MDPIEVRAIWQNQVSNTWGSLNRWFDFPQMIAPQGSADRDWNFLAKSPILIVYWLGFVVLLADRSFLHSALEKTL